MTYLSNIPAGQYEAVAVAAWINDRRLKQDGSYSQEHLVVRFRLLENGPNGEPAYGQEVEWRGFFSEKALKRTLQSMRYCGWLGDDVTRVQTMTEAGGGRRVFVDVAHEEFNGKLHTRVSFVNAERSGPREMPEAQRATFAEEMRRRVKLEVAKDPTLASTSNPAAEDASAPKVPF